MALNTWEPKTKKIVFGTQRVNYTQLPHTKAKGHCLSREVSCSARAYPRGTPPLSAGPRRRPYVRPHGARGPLPGPGERVCLVRPSVLSFSLAGVSRGASRARPGELKGGGCRWLLLWSFFICLEVGHVPTASSN